LYHDNGKSVVCIYGQWETLGFKEDIDATSIGPTVAFNICDMDGTIIGYDEVSRLAALNRPSIQLRTGCFCNPGACQDALMLSDQELIENWRSGHVCGDQRGNVNGRPTGCIRASFGKDSLWEDMDALVSFIENVFVSRMTSMKSKESCSASSTASQFCIESIFIFPIKSCAAMQVQKWPIECNTGRLLFDREFALVDTSGVAMRLSSYPKMSHIKPFIDMSTKTITISAPEHDHLVLSIEKSDDSSISSKEVEVCGVLCTGNSWGGREASNWFTSVLGVRCWLVRHEKVADKKVPSKQNRISYSNEAALLLVSTQSISILNSIIRAQGWGRQVDSRHFRPNIVVSTKDPDNQIIEDVNTQHPEDSWERISILTGQKHVDLLSAGKCARCQMVDIDPTSGMKGNTLRALAQYRRDRGQIYFGTFFSGLQNGKSEVVWIEVGDKIQSVK
jgi:molybdenum cofactor sulfurtransferase